MKFTKKHIGKEIEVISALNHYSFKKGNIARIYDVSSKYVHIAWLPNQLNKDGKPLIQSNGKYNHSYFKLKTNNYEIY